MRTHYEFSMQKYNKLFRLKKILNAFLNYEFLKLNRTPVKSVFTLSKF